MTDLRTEATATGSSESKPTRPAGRTKSDDLRRLLSRRSGASVAQLQKQFGWQPHTVRAAISRLIPVCGEADSRGIPLSADF